MNLTPLGTVRRRLGAPELKATPFPSWLVESARECDLGEEVVHLAWEVARCASRCSPRKHEALMTLVVASVGALREGSTRLRVKGGQRSLAARFEELGASPEHHALAMELLGEESEVLGRPGEYKPFILEGSYLYAQRVYEQEREIAARLKARLDQKPDRGEYTKILDALDRVLEHCGVANGKPIRLSAEQQQAIRTLLTQPLTLVSGGPGTGKTSIIVSVLRVLARLQVPMERVGLTAPTGKAAKRMAESLELGLGAIPEPKIVDAALAEALPEPVTLHRLLGYSEKRGRYRFNEQNPLPLRFVVVDEASRIDVDLMSRLVRAVHPKTRLVLMGDVDRLPSVAGGAVFRDLVQAAGTRAAVELKQGYRTDRRDPGRRHLFRIARLIPALSGDDDSERLFDAGSMEDETILMRVQASDVEFRGVELLEGDRDNFLERWFEDRVMTPPFREWIGEGDPDERTCQAILSHLASHRILCVTNRDAERINGMFRALHTSRRGEPVMISQNDDARGLFQGDQGVTLPAGVTFEGKTFHDPELLRRHLSPSYATTVHESEGSEHEQVALVLPDHDHPLLTRELLETAMTRARKSVTVLGTREVLSAGLRRSVERSSGIAKRLS